jgi:hypothetical protein
MPSNAPGKSLICVGCGKTAYWKRKLEHLYKQLEVRQLLGTHRDGKRAKNTQCAVKGVSIRQIDSLEPGPGRREDPEMDSLVSGSAAARNRAGTKVDMEVPLPYCLLKIPGKAGIHRVLCLLFPTKPPFALNISGDGFET